MIFSKMPTKINQIKLLDAFIFVKIVVKVELGKYSSRGMKDSSSYTAQQQYWTDL